MLDRWRSDVLVVVAAWPHGVLPGKPQTPAQTAPRYCSRSSAWPMRVEYQLKGELIAVSWFPRSLGTYSTRLHTWRGMPQLVAVRINYKL